MKNNSKKKKLSGTLITAAIIIVLIAVVLISGIRPCVVLSGSMEPAIPTWSLCFVDTRVSYDDIVLGDVVVYDRRADDRRIIHRVVKIEDEGITTKGDANLITDGVSVGRDNLYGKELFHIPYIGYICRFAKNPFVLIALAVIIVLLNVTDLKGKKKKKQDSEISSEAESAVLNEPTPENENTRPEEKTE